MHGGADGTDTDAAIVAPADGGGSILVVAAAVRASTICRFSSGGGWDALRTQPEFGDAGVPQRGRGDERNCLSKAS